MDNKENLEKVYIFDLMKEFYYYYYELECYSRDIYCNCKKCNYLSNYESYLYNNNGLDILLGFLNNISYYYNDRSYYKIIKEYIFTFDVQNNKDKINKINMMKQLWLDYQLKYQTNCEPDDKTEFETKLLEIF